MEVSRHSSLGEYPEREDESRAWEVSHKKYLRAKGEQHRLIGPRAQAQIEHNEATRKHHEMIRQRFDSRQAMETAQTAILTAQDWISKLQREIEIAQNHVEELDQEIQRLDVSRLSEFEEMCKAELELEVHNQRWQEIDGMLTRAFVPFAQASCRNLITEVENKLPRELQDMIYDELVDLIGMDSLFGSVECLYRLGWEPESIAHIPYFLDKAYIGEYVATKLVKTAFACFRGQEVEFGRQNLLYFVTGDPFGLGISPVPYLSKIFLLWNADEKRPPSHYLSDIEALQLLKPKEELAISIQICADIGHMKIERVRELLDSFEPAHKHLTRNFSKSKFLKLKKIITFFSPCRLL